VDENARWEVVAYAYPQATHATDGSHTTLKWDEVKVYEKLGTAIDLGRSGSSCTADKWFLRLMCHMQMARSPCCTTTRTSGTLRLRVCTPSPSTVW
jgi:hypothetical protein